MIRLKKQWTKTESIILGVCILFYLLFPILDGPVWCVDSASYVSMNITREPLYPTFLLFSRKMSFFGVDALLIAVILQSILAGITTWYVSYCVKDITNQNRYLQIMAVFFQFAVSLLCRFAAIRGSVYTDCIMTEGLGLSLFNLFIIQLYYFIQNNKISLKFKGGGGLFFTALALVCLRKQMTITVLVIAVTVTWYYLFRYKKVKIWLGLIVAAGMIIVAGKLVDRTYNYAVRGAWIEHSGNSMGLLCTLLYSSDMERDSALFEDQTIRELYTQIMEEADRQQLLYPYAGEGWLNLTSHYADSYDAIGYGIINPAIEGYLSANYELDEVESALAYDQLCKRMVRVLFRQNPRRIIEVYIWNTWKGLVNSIARAGAILSLYALLAYAGIAGLSVYLIRWCGKRQEGKLAEQVKKSLCFTFIVMLSIIINALVVGLMIFSQPRYMIYGMGLFYVAYTVLLYDVWLICKEKFGRTKQSI